MKTCQHQMKYRHCAEKHFSAKCHITSDNRGMECALCGGEHETWFNVCEYRKKEKSHIDAKSAKISELYKTNKSSTKVSRGMDDDLPTEWRLITSGKRRRSVDKPAPNSTSESVPRGAGLTALYYERRFPKASVRRVE